MKKSEKQEKALVKKAMRGSPKAFGDLIEAQQEYLYRMAYRAMSAKRPTPWTWCRRAS